MAFIALHDTALHDIALCMTLRCMALRRVAWRCRATLAMIPSGESEANRRKNKSGDYEVSPQARTRAFTFKYKY